MALPVGYGAFVVAAVFLVMVEGAAVNNRPVIGVLAQASPTEGLKYGQEYMMSEYVKYLEMAGAAVVAVKGAQPVDYYIDLFKKINGVLLPGGGVSLTNSSFARSSHIMLSLAVKANDKGDHFPVWGTCQGFEMLTVLAAGKNLLSTTDAENLPLPLVLLPAYKESRMLGSAPSDIIHYLTTEKVTANFHHMCLATETYKRVPSLNKFYRVMSINKGRKGLEFVSTMEAYKYPFYGVQWHPEKNVFTRRLDQNVAHTAHAVRVTQYLANFFVDEARKSSHRFATDQEMSKAVVENDVRVFLQKKYLEDFFYNVTKH